MKTNRLLLGMMVLASLNISAASAQSRRNAERQSSPAEQFSLEGALDLFRQASSPEELERLLNTPDNDVNNLDLNRDGQTDYVRVLEKVDGNAHVFILQTPLGEYDNQDVAVIELERTGPENAMVQIVGDEDLFGENSIVEPYAEDMRNDQMRAPGYEQGPSGYRRGPSGYLGDPLDYAGGASAYGSDPSAYPGNAPDRIVVNVWTWPIVIRVYGPHYRVWVSPWGWNRRPTWYRPWRPAPVQVFYPRSRHYHPRYVVVRQHRTIRAHGYYTPMRTRSATVSTYHGRHGQKVRVVRTPGRRRW